MKEFEPISSFFVTEEKEIIVSEKTEENIIEHMQEYAVTVEHREIEAYNCAATVLLNY